MASPPVQTKIPLSVPDLSGNESKYVDDVMRSSWISAAGPYLERFESEFAQLCGTTKCLAVANGTVALHLSLVMLDVRPGDEVILPSFTYVATANALKYVGAEPVFVDVDPQTWCIDPKKIEAAITPRTKGIMPVHLFGHPADMDSINEIAGLYNLWVLEDAAEATLARYKGRMTGSLSTVATFSFHGTKVFTCGEGGAITLSDERMEKFGRMIRGHGMDPNRRFYFPVVGYNYRLTNLACAILCGQMERWEAMLRRREEIFALYHKLLAECPGLGFRPVAPWARLSPWLFSVTIDPKAFGRPRQEVMDGLAKQGIDSRPFFIPVHTLPVFRQGSEQRGTDLPVTDHLCGRGINLPTYVGLGDEAIARVSAALIGLAR